MNRNHSNLIEKFGGNSSALSSPDAYYRNWINDSYPEEWVNIENFAGQFAIPRRMFRESASTAETAKPLDYHRPSQGRPPPANSSKSLSASVSEYYAKIENQLSRLSKPDEVDDGVEEGAVSSAIAVVEQLKQSNLAPPALSWHGGDAVVMLWALGDITYAITVTEGEVGYVVRQNKKAIRMADSIQLKAFRLSDLR